MNRLLNSSTELDLKTLFLASFFIGLVAIGLSGIFIEVYWVRAVGVIVSALCVLAYAFIGQKQSGVTKSQTIDQVADSSYYLGFLFTLSSLIIALANVAFGDFLNDESISSLLSSFALALLTTIIGLMCKILLSQFDATLTQQRAKAMGDLTRATTQFSTKLNNSTMKVDSYLDSANAKILATNEEAVKHLLSISKQHIEGLFKSISDLNRIKEEDFRQTHDATENIISKINEKTAQYETTIEGLFMGMRTSQSEFSASSLEFADTVKNSTSNIQSFAQSIDQIEMAFGKQADLIQKTGELNHKLIEDMQSKLLSFAEPHKTLNELKADTEQLATNFQKLDSSISHAIESIQEFSGVFPDERDTSLKLSSLEERISTCTASVEKLSLVCKEFEHRMNLINYSLDDQKSEQSGFFRRFRDR